MAGSNGVFLFVCLFVCLFVFVSPMIWQFCTAHLAPRVTTGGGGHNKEVATSLIPRLLVGGEPGYEAR